MPITDAELESHLRQHYIRASCNAGEIYNVAKASADRIAEHGQEIARLTTEHGRATDEPNPTGTTHARLNWWKQTCDESRERHAAETAIRWTVQQIDQNANADRLVADYQRGEK
jgi:hypothetical protein